MHGPEPDERLLQPQRQVLVGQILVGPHRVPAEGGDLPGVQQGVGRRLGQIAQIAVPGVGEVQLVPRFFDDPDDIGPVLQGGHERGEVPAAEQVGNPLEVVEVQVLPGQEDHQMIGERMAHPVQFPGLGHTAQVDAGDRGPERSGHRLHHQRCHRRPR